MENPYPWYTPRMWHGMLVGDWWRLLSRNVSHIAPSNLGLAMTITCAAPANSCLRMISEGLYRKKIAWAKISAPLFVVGHWRSGTTLLHELLSLDDQFTFPTTYQCLVPHHFLFSTSWLAPIIQWMMPKHRPMDSMQLRLTLPQEDEFALCNLGAVSPYLAWGFPQQYPHWPALLDTEELSPDARQAWQQALLWFARRLSAAAPKRIIFKSPPHTARIKAIREVFPMAQFVHIVRDPYEVFRSTVRTWRAMTETQWIGKTDFEALEDQIFEAFTRMYRAFERDRADIPARQFHELRFEDLIADPISVMGDLYQQLNLGPYDQARSNLETYFQERKAYRKHEYERDPELEQRIQSHWGEFTERFGYSYAQ